jgi:peptidoglycan hydrolase CwlO-like protein
MNQSIPSNLTGEAALEAEVEQMLTQLKALQSQIKNDREKILTLQSETRAILDNVFSVLKAA